MFGRITSSEAISKDFGLLILRVGIGSSLAILHGYDKITAGPETWAAIGQNMQHVGIHFAPAFWGFMAGFAEFVCSILLILGPLFRTATLLLGFNMFIAVMHHLSLPAGSPASGLMGASHALELLVVFVALFFTGPGRFAFKLGRVK